MDKYCFTCGREGKNIGRFLCDLCRDIDPKIRKMIGRSRRAVRRLIEEKEKGSG